MKKAKQPYAGCSDADITASAKKALAKHGKHEDTIRALRFALLAGKVPAEKGTGFYKAASMAAIVKFLGGDKAESVGLIKAAADAGAIRTAAVYGFMVGYTFHGIDAPAPAQTAAEKLAEVRKQYGDI